MLKKILTLGVIAIMLFSLTACGSSQEIEFTVGTAFARKYGELITITKIIDSLDRLSDSDIADIISIDEKYDVAFFESNSLVIVSFTTHNMGGRIDKITLTKKGNRLNVYIDGYDGLMTSMDQVVVALEVTKESISGAKTVKFTTTIEYIKHKK